MTTDLQLATHAFEKYERAMKHSKRPGLSRRRVSYWTKIMVRWYKKSRLQFRMTYGCAIGNSRARIFIEKTPHGSVVWCGGMDNADNMNL
jgi:hypothetical protein